MEKCCNNLNPLFVKGYTICFMWKLKKYIVLPAVSPLKKPLEIDKSAAPWATAAQLKQRRQQWRANMSAASSHPLSIWQMVISTAYVQKRWHFSLRTALESLCMPKAISTVQNTERRVLCVFMYFAQKGTSLSQFFFCQFMLMKRLRDCQRWGSCRQGMSGSGDKAQKRQCVSVICTRSKICSLLTWFLKMDEQKRRININGKKKKDRNRHGYSQGATVTWLGLQIPEKYSKTCWKLLMGTLSWEFSKIKTIQWA